MSKKFIFITAAGLVFLLGAALYWKTLSLSQPSVPIPSPNAAITDKNTIAHTWQWDKFSKKAATSLNSDDSSEAKSEKRTSMVEEVPYDVVRIYDMLQEVRLDETGNVIVDREAKNALEKAFAELGSDIGPFGISQLQDLIRIGLPGIAGEQTAEILAQYYDFRLAEEDLLAQSHALTTDEEAQNYEQLVKLRRSYLGHEVAEKLYAGEELQARHMLASMTLLRDPNLSDEEKQKQQEHLQQQLNQQLASLNLLDTESAMRDRVSQLREQGASDSDIFTARAEFVGAEQALTLAEADREQNQWQQRFDRFWQERQQIAQAGLSEADQQQQIESLLSSHFNGDEIERARNSRPQRAE
jgi:lipase chaperone LimK